MEYAREGRELRRRVQELNFRLEIFRARARESNVPVCPERFAIDAITIYFVFVSTRFLELCKRRD